MTQIPGYFLFLLPSELHLESVADFFLILPHRPVLLVRYPINALSNGIPVWSGT